MGSWFSNISLRRTGRVRQEDILRQVSERMARQGYDPAPSPEEADVSFAVVGRPDSRWLTLYSDGMEPGGGISGGMAAEISEALGTEALEIACFDSDYLCLNLIDAASKLDAWAGVGSAAGLGLKRRTGLAAWKGRVEDFPRFKASLRQERLFAEDALHDLAPCLGLPAEQSNARYEELGDGQGARLHFRLRDRGETDEPVRLRLLSSGGFCPSAEAEPCEQILAANEGRASRGLSVYFIAPGLESGAIALEGVCLVLPQGRERVTLPIRLEKVRLTDGRMALRCHAPDVRIPGRAPDGLPLRRLLEEQYSRAVGLRFLTRGEPDQVADLFVDIVPDERPEGHMPWRMCSAFGSKEAFIEHRRACQAQLAEWRRNHQAPGEAGENRKKPD